MLSMLVYGLSSVQLYTISAVYHIGHWHGRRDTVLRALDHASIFILIAGTYVPFCVNILPDQLRLMLLVVVWVLALTGAALSVVTIRLPRWLGVGLYVAIGWVGLVPAPTLLQTFPPPALAMLLLGGALYTVGAIIYARRRPDPWPQLFGFHELFHVLVIAANATFLATIWIWVVPFPRP